MDELMGRFKAPGICTNYEMNDLRDAGKWRDMRWVHVWSALSYAEHPRSQAEWDEMLDDMQDE